MPKQICDITHYFWFMVKFLILNGLKLFLIFQYFSKKKKKKKNTYLIFFKVSYLLILKFECFVASYWNFCF